MKKRKLTPIDKIILTALAHSLQHRVEMNARNTSKSLCLCGCGTWFNSRGKYHQFYNRTHYQRAHRIPGFVRRFIDHKD
jgi:hypothetical protein